MSTGQERLEILEMIEEGTISPQEGLNLIRALEPEERKERLFPSGQAGNSGDQSGPEEQGPEPVSMPQMAGLLTWKRWWVLPFLLGMGITLLGGGWMYTAWDARGFGLLFLIAWIPFIVGVLILAFSWKSRNSPWLHLRVRQKPGKTPQRIAFSFPLPLGLMAWALKTFGKRIPQAKNSGVDEIILALQDSTLEEMPLIIDVDEGEEGEKVQIIIA